MDACCDGGNGLSSRLLDANSLGHLTHGWPNLRTCPFTIKQFTFDQHADVWRAIVLPALFLRKANRPATEVGKRPRERRILVGHSGFPLTALKMLVSRPPHIPGRCADEHFFALDDETKLFVKFDVFRAVGFEVAGRFCLLEIVDVTIHQRRAHSLSLHRGSDANGSEMDVGRFGIEMAPSGKPPNHLWKRF